jgi:hypothetical protein
MLFMKFIIQECGMIRIVATAKECVRNIERFEAELNKCPGLQDRLSQARAWYAHQGEDGQWHFGPSKFVGYVGLDGEKYLEMAQQQLDGKRTEAQLQQWFEELDTDDPMFETMAAELSLFLARYNKVPSVKMRINVLPEKWPEEEVAVLPRPNFANLPDEDPKDLLVDLIIAVVETLEPRHVKRLREHLSRR